MTQPDALREAVERNARAVMEGNFSQLMADITPEALAQMMAMAPAGATPGGMSLAQMPSISGYTIEDLGAEDDGHVYQVRFESPSGSATLAATWKQVVGQWKITAVRVVSIEPSQG